MNAARRGVIFDLDGTLSESGPGIVGALKHALATAGLPVPGDDVLQLAIGPTWSGGMREFGVPDERLDEVILAYRAVYDVSGVLETRIYDGVVEMLDELAARGCTLCVATSKPEHLARRVVDHLGFDGRFHALAGASDHDRHSKADVIAHLLGELDGFESDELVMVGDRSFDVEGAAAHGIDAIGVTWGYGSLAELQAAGAWAIADTPDDVVGMVVGDERSRGPRSRRVP